MIIKDIEVRDIDIVANLHKNNLISPSSKIGEDYLKKLYALLLSDPKTHVFLVAREKGKIVGSITATKDLGQTNKLLEKLISFSTFFIIFKAILSRKVTIIELFRRFMFEQTVLKRYPKPYASILALFVDKRHQRLGIGGTLIETILKKLKKMGIKKVYVDTLITNNKAFLFYKSLGFIEKKIFNDSRILEKQL